jgi:hypothetical protein
MILSGREVDWENSPRDATIDPRGLTWETRLVRHRGAALFRRQAARRRAAGLLAARGMWASASGQVGAIAPGSIGL